RRRSVDVAGKERPCTHGRSDRSVGDRLSASHFAIDDRIRHWTSVCIPFYAHPRDCRSEKAQFSAVVFCGGGRQHGKRTQCYEGAGYPYEHRLCLVGTTSSKQLAFDSGFVLDWVRVPHFSG